MKRALLCIFTAILIMSMMVSALATSSTYELPELGLEITIPSEYSVITKNTAVDAPIFDRIGTTKADLMRQFESKNIYLNAINSDVDEEIVVTMSENEINNFTLLDDTALQVLASGWVKEYKNYGVEVSKYEIYQHSQAKFVRVYFVDAATLTSGVQYYTIYDNKAINFTLRSYSGAISERQENDIKMVVDNVKFKKNPPEQAREETEAFLYTDEDSRVTFTVPANWKQKPLLEEKETIDVKFVSTQEDGCMIFYGSTDLWEQMPASVKMGKKRADVDNSVFSKSDLADMFETTIDKISEVTYNNISYYQCETTSSSELFGADVSATLTLTVYISDGWMYSFQFSGTSTNERFTDYQNLLNSVQYPENNNLDDANSGVSVNTPNTDIKDTADSSIAGTIVILVLLLFVAGVIIIAIVFREKTSASDFSSNEVTTNHINVEETPEVRDGLTFSRICKKCGNSLPEDSQFCHICGTRIDEE